jgi:hypothetical protein
MQGESFADISRWLGPTAQTCRNIIRKYAGGELDGGFPGRGGTRESCVKITNAAKLLIMESHAIDPTLMLDEYQALLLRDGFVVSTSQLSHVINKHLKLLIKKVTVYRPERFTPRNIQKTREYLALISQVPAHKLRFLDECAFTARIGGRDKGRGKTGERVNVERRNPVGYFRWSLLAMTCMRQNQAPVHWMATEVLPPRARHHLYIPACT